MNYIDGLCDLYAYQQGTRANAALCAVLDLVDDKSLDRQDDAEVERVFNEFLQLLTDSK